VLIQKNSEAAEYRRNVASKVNSGFGFDFSRPFHPGRFNVSCWQSGVSSFKTSAGAAACYGGSGASSSGFGKATCERNGSISIKYPITPAILSGNVGQMQSN
jgi:hypothetical protein